MGEPLPVEDVKQGEGAGPAQADKPVQGADKSPGGKQRKGVGKGRGAKKGAGKARPRAFVVDEEAFDGAWAQRADAPLAATEVACKYKQLWCVVEQCFRQARSLLRTRPIFHRTDAASRGHVFRSFRAPVLREELRRRMAERGIETEWGA